MHVEDYPSDEVLETTGATRQQLCGLYTGVPLTKRSVEYAARLPDMVTVYREGILRAASAHTGELSESALRQQIHVTVLHELGHHHGLNEDDLRQLGYG